MAEAPASADAGLARARPRLRPLLQALFDLAFALAAMLALSFVFMAAWAVLLALLQDGAAATLEARLRQPGVGVQIAMTVFVTALPALLLAAWRRPPAPPAAHAGGATWAWAVAVGVGVFVLVNGAVALVERLGLQATPSNVALVEEAIRTRPLLLVLFAVGLAPLYEELLFRRVIFRRLWAAGHPGLGMAVSGAAFALLHEPPLLSGHPAAAFALLWTAYGLMGAAFAWVYRRTGTLWAAIGAHALNNALGCALLFFTAR